jgi:mono/diheme cytochrome c family protein
MKLSPKLIVFLLFCVWQDFPGHAETTYGETLFLFGDANTKMTVGNAVGGHTTAIACSGCHGRDAEGNAEGNAAAPTIAWNSLTSLAVPYSPDKLQQTLASGTAPDGRKLSTLMPRYQLSSVQAMQVVQYLQSVSREQRDGASPGEVRIDVDTSKLRPENEIQFMRGLTLALSDKMPWGRKIMIVPGKDQRGFLRVTASERGVTITANSEITFCAMAEDAVRMILAENAPRLVSAIGRSDELGLLSQTFPQLDVVNDLGKADQKRTVVVLDENLPMPASLPQGSKIYMLNKTAKPALLGENFEIHNADLCAMRLRPKSQGVTSWYAEVGYTSGTAIIEGLAAAGRSLTKHRFQSSVSGKTLRAGNSLVTFEPVGTSLPGAVQILMRSKGDRHDKLD